MSKPKNKADWYIIAIGLFLFVCFFYKSAKNIDENELVKKTLIVSNSIEKIRVGKTMHYYRFYTTTNNCSFIIKTAGGMAAKWENIENITKGDTLQVEIHNSRLTDLVNKVEEVPIYSLEKNGEQIFTVSGYNKAQQTYDRRWGILFITIGSILLLRGFTLITSKMAYIMAVIGFVVIMALRFLHISW